MMAPEQTAQGSIYSVSDTFNISNMTFPSPELSFAEFPMISFSRPLGGDTDLCTQLSLENSTSLTLPDQVAHMYETGPISEVRLSKLSCSKYFLTRMIPHLDLAAHQIGPCHFFYIVLKGLKQKQ